MNNKLSPTHRTWGSWFGRGAIAFFILGWIGYFGIQGFDHQFANLVFTLLSLLAFFLGAIWLSLNRSIPFWIRVAWPILPVLGIAAFGLLFEFRGFSGEMVPQFRLRNASSRSSSATIEARANHASTAELSENAPNFRQFLGNDRNGIVRDIRLSEKWDAESPRIVWKKPIGRGWASFSIQSGLAITLEEFDNRDCVVALDWDDGSLRWRTPLGRKHFHAMDSGGPNATPTIDADQLFIQSSTGIVCCCEFASGKIVWKVDLLEKAGITQQEAELAVAWGRSGSPLLYGDMVIVPFGGAPARSAGGLIALDRSTGEERWRGGTAQISYASPSVMTIAGIEQIVIVNESSASGHNPNTGEVLWSHPWPGQSNGAATVSQAVYIDSMHVLLSKGYGGGAEMLDFSSSVPPSWVATSRWKEPSLLKTKFTSTILRDGYLYGLSDGILECVHADSGKRAWKDTRHGRVGHGQLLFVGEHVLLCSEDGRLILGRANRDGFQKLGEIEVLTGITWNTIAIAGNRVFLRNSEYAVCIELAISD